MTTTDLEPATQVTDLVIRQRISDGGETIALSPFARSKFSQADLDLIASRYSLAVGERDVRPFMGLLEQAAQLDLSPVNGELWLVKFNGRWTAMCGRDGYLKIARRHDDFITVVGGVHREKDEFSAHYDHEKGWVVDHRQVGGIKQRGEILGAWAVLKRHGKPDTYFYADRDQYDKSGGQRANAWDTHPDAMIIKVPQSYVIRLAYGITGPEPADEIALGAGAGDVINARTVAPTPAGAPAPQDAGKSEAAASELPEELRAKLNRAYALDKVLWNRNEVMARIAPVGHQDHESSIAALDAEVSAWLELHEPQDAEVIEEPDDEPTGDIVPDAPVTLESLDERYATDKAFRDAVAPLIGSRIDLEAAADDDAAYNEPLQEVIDQLETLGVPDIGWVPGTTTKAAPQAAEGEVQAL